MFCEASYYTLHYILQMFELSLAFPRSDKRQDARFLHYQKTAHVMTPGTSLDVTSLPSNVGSNADETKSFTMSTRVYFESVLVNSFLED